MILLVIEKGRLKKKSKQHCVALEVSACLCFGERKSFWSEFVCVWVCCCDRCSWNNFFGRSLWVFALTSTWPYYSIPVWHARAPSAPTTLLWFLEKHAVCFNGNWILRGGIFSTGAALQFYFQSASSVFRVKMRARRQARVSQTPSAWKDVRRAQNCCAVRRCQTKDRGEGVGRSVRVVEVSVGGNSNPASCFTARHLQTADKVIMIQDTTIFSGNTLMTGEFDFLRPPHKGALRNLGPFFQLLVSTFKSVVRCGMFLTKMTCNIKEVLSCNFIQMLHLFNGFGCTQSPNFKEASLVFKRWNLAPPYCQPPNESVFDQFRIT